MNTFLARDEAGTRAVGADLAIQLRAGDVVFLEGELGAGKTTLVRGLLEALGHDGPVRSPTFNLVQTFSTDPPVMHADLYRVRSYEGIGLEDYLDTHLCLVEWPDRAEGLVDDPWRIVIAFEGTGRRIEILPPSNPTT
jgi:tRNA threonylcarbamoyladenosine biosynthesis protein TsaE